MHHDKGKQTMNVFEAIFQDLERFAALLDAEGRIVEANKALLQLSGLTCDEIKGMSVFDFVSLSRRRESISTFQRFMESDRGSTEVEDHFTHDDGQRGYATVTLFKVPEGADDEVAVLAIISDVTRQKRLAQLRRERESATRRAFGDVVLAMTGGRLLVIDDSEIEDQLGELVFGPFAFCDDLAPGEIRHQARVAVESLVREAAWDDGFEVAMGEAIVNALQHAGGGVFSLHMYQNVLQARVSDSGPGLDFSHIARHMLYLDEGEDLDFQLGVGFTLMLSFTSRIFIAASDTGTTLVLESRTE